MRALYIVGQLFVVVFVILTMTISLPHNPLSIYNSEVTSTFQSFLPEGWAFFTRNPKEDEVIIYYKENGKWIQNPLTPLSKPGNSFGLNRLVRAQSVEMAMIIPQPSEKDWQHCKGNFVDCIKKDTTKIIEVRNISPMPILKDTIAIVSYSPVPWAWSELKKSEEMPAKYVILKVICGKK